MQPRYHRYILVAANSSVFPWKASTLNNSYNPDVRLAATLNTNNKKEVCGRTYRSGTEITARLCNYCASESLLRSTLAASFIRGTCGFLFIRSAPSIDYFVFSALFVLIAI